MFIAEATFEARLRGTTDQANARNPNRARWRDGPNRRVAFGEIPPKKVMTTMTSHRPSGNGMGENAGHQIGGVRPVSNFEGKSDRRLFDLASTLVLGFLLTTGPY